MLEIKTQIPQDVVAVVTGVHTGEETKGAAVEWLARELNAHTVIRNGGSQAGHHIVTSDGREQMFSHFGAATFDGAQTYLRHMVIDPVLLFREAMELEAKGVDDPFSLITIDGENISITPFHGALSRFKEILRSEKKGTVGLGVGDAVKDAQHGEVTIRAKDFLGNKAELLVKVEAIRQHKIQQAFDLVMALGIKEIPDDANSEMKILQNAELVSITVQSFQYLAELLQISDDTHFEQILNTPGNLVTEPSHGALLHPFAFAPHTTQVDPTSKELIEELKQNGKKRIIRLGVGRSYMTRHGAGPLVSFDREMTDSIHETHNAANAKANEWLGEFRVGHYDLIATRYGLAIAGGTEAFDGLMISYLDVINTHQQWGVVEAYKFEGEATDLPDYFELNGDLITGIKVHQDTRDEAHYNYQLRLTELLKKCTPVVTYLSPTEDTSLEEVFIHYVEEKTGIPVVAVSRGPKAEDREKRPAWDIVFHAEAEKELPESEMVYRPFGVDLYFAGKEDTHLPYEVATHPDLLREAAIRRELNQLLTTAFNKIPDPTLRFDQAVERGMLKTSEVEAIYQRLSEFIQADPNHGRIILYLPSQLLPHLQKDTSNSSATLQFADAYKNAWLRLMYESEPRASYVDGDILEESMGLPARVRKAGHLIPDMLESGLIDFSEITRFLKINDEAELLESLTAGLMVSRDKKLISDADWQVLQEMASLKPEIMKVLTTQISLNTQIHADLQTELAAIETQYSAESAYVAAVSPARIQWEKSVKIEVALDSEAEVQAKRVQTGETTINEVLVMNTLVGIKTIARIGEQLLAKIDLEKARIFAAHNLPALEKQWHAKEGSVQDVVLTALSHWCKLGIIQSHQLEKFGIELPDLSSPFPLNLEKRQTVDFGYAIEAAKKIQEHPTLSQYLFPIIVEVGSRVKGQAGINSDYDGGIVFKPETPWEKCSEILELLRQDVAELGRIQKPLEFWLSHNQTGYGLKTAPPDIKTAVNPAQAHFFLNGVWTSLTPEFQTIYEDFMKKHVDLSRFSDQKDEVRRQLLRQIEVDMLQYRLLHKGYRRFYPSAKAEGTTHAELIDWESDYWDPGYKRIATQLFLSRVFLPDLS